MEEARNYKRYRLPHLQETEDSPPVKKVKLRNYDGCNRTKIMKDLLNISFMKQRLEEHDDIEEVESDPVLRNYLMATQNDYGQMFDDTVRSFLSKEGLLTDVDIRGIKDTRQRELMENPNSFASLFQENYKHDYKNPKCRIFDAKLGGLNSRLNRINRKKDLQYLKFRRRVEAEKNKMKKKIRAMIATTMMVIREVLVKYRPLKQILTGLQIPSLKTISLISIICGKMIPHLNRNK